MQKELIEMVFILDRSGSMAHLTQDTIDGFNAMIHKQKGLEGHAIVSTILFDDKFEVLYNRVPLHELRPLSKKTYYVRGSTALYDAIGRSITKVKALQRQDEVKPTQTIFIINTDGYENASHEYTIQEVKRMITSERIDHDWQFIFMGANIDAIEIASQIGIEKKHAKNYHPDGIGVKYNYAAMSDAITSYRRYKVVDEAWANALDDDFELRKKKD